LFSLHREYATDAGAVPEERRGLNVDEMKAPGGEADAAVFAALGRFRRLMARLLLLMLALVALGVAGLKRGAAGWAVHAVFALAALAALAMLLAPLAMAWLVRKR
jgi:hypothetical protein